MENPFAWALTTIVSAFVGSYLAAYLKKKGENLAIHEDINQLVEQVKATTEATKAIEARIDDQVWNKQRQWELRRDALFEVVRTLGSLDDALLELYSAYNADLPEDEDRRSIFLASRATKYSNWYEASVKFDAARFLAELICGRKVDEVLNECIIFVRAVSLRITHGEPTSYLDSGIERLTKIQAVYASIRKELNLEPEA